ncbi:MAG: hypothetical protein D6753_17040, partial [Planctomycetota bacterium]
MRMAYFWPGFSLAWKRGAAGGLLVAVLFAWWFCATMLATWVWRDWWPVGGVWLSWAGILVLAAGHAIWEAMRPNATPRLEEPAELATAHDEYLRGNWFEAEALALRMLERDPNDIATGLLLVGVLRATQRYEAALDRLQQLELLDAASAWWFEIRRERQRIESARASDTEPEE